MPVARCIDSMIKELRRLLWGVRELAGSNFTGIGVLICDEPEKLPIVPLRRVSTFASGGDLAASLAAISMPESEFHDGFHIISSHWKLVLVSQYFSPPIVPGAAVDRTRRFGGRYMAALFGSALPAVICAGIASNGFGVAIFKNGSELSYDVTP